MRISLLTFGVIASIITTATFANQVITSQTYVDNQDALKQNKIPATGTNASTPGTTVVTYTGTAGTIGERGIVSGWENYDYDNGTDDNKLVTAGAVLDIAEQISPLPDYQPVTVTTKTCNTWLDGQAHTDANCILWNLTDEEIQWARCYSWRDCCTDQSNCACINGICEAILS